LSQARIISSSIFYQSSNHLNIHDNCSINLVGSKLTSCTKKKKEIKTSETNWKKFVDETEITIGLRTVKQETWKQHREWWIWIMNVKWRTNWESLWRLDADEWGESDEER
jgi:hypothetical protein